MPARRLCVLAAVAWIGAGCATNTDVARKTAQIHREVPECYSAEECEVMWSAARRWVLAHSTRKLQHVTDDFLETYNPEPYSPYLAMRVEKVPLPGGSGYQIGITVWCNNMFGCSPDKLDAMLAFNKAVSAGQTRVHHDDPPPLPGPSLSPPFAAGDEPYIERGE